MKCASCNAAATPDRRSELEPPQLEAFFRRFSETAFKTYISSYHSGVITWTGGEPFASPKSLETGLKLAGEYGFRSEILTGGSWFLNSPRLLDIPVEINQQMILQGAWRSDDILSGRIEGKKFRCSNSVAGLNSQIGLRISIDAEHQRHTSLDVIMELTASAAQKGLEVNFTIREIPGEKHMKAPFLDRLKKELPDYYKQNAHRSRWINIIPHMPLGSGQVSSRRLGTKNKNGGIPGREKWRRPCRMGFKDLIWGSDGLIYPCCGMFSIPGYERFALGEAISADADILYNDGRQNPLLSMLRREGPAGVCRALGLDPDTLAHPGMREPCELCLQLFHAHPAISL